MMNKKPAFVARELLHSVGWIKPGDLSLEEIASNEGIHINFCQMKGAEGRILIKENHAIVSVNSNISLLGKRNFVIAHELGHFKLHKDINPLFSDTHKTLSEWHKKGVHEQEANEFASELLMPSTLFKDYVSGERLSLDLIEDVADYFQVSLTAAFLKYRLVGDFPLMVIYIENGLVKWKQCSADFPFQYLPKDTKVSPLTVAGDFFNGNGIEEEPVLIEAIEWFMEDFEIEKKKNWKLWEQCFQVSKNGIISCLWTF